jgi:hypothetical protein
LTAKKVVFIDGAFITARLYPIKYYHTGALSTLQFPQRGSQNMLPFWFGVIVGKTLE